MTIRTKQGLFTIPVGAKESIGRSLYRKRQYELKYQNEALAFLRDINKCPPKGQGTVIDIGANIGVISIGMLYRGEMDKAIAIEPEPNNFSLLSQNVKQNDLVDRIYCMPYAVSDKSGELLFELCETSGGDHRVRVEEQFGEATEKYGESSRRVITVKADMLDTLIKGLPEDYVDDIVLGWVDVQGYEGYVFQGAKDLFTSKGIPLVSEIWPYGIHRAGMSTEQFCAIVRDIWTSYWVLRENTFVEYPTEKLEMFFEELGYDGDFENIIFTS
jgi:FkbM family methyltransferase